MGKFGRLHWALLAYGCIATGAAIGFWQSATKANFHFHRQGDQYVRENWSTGEADLLTSSGWVPVDKVTSGQEAAR